MRIAPGMAKKLRHGLQVGVGDAYSILKPDLLKYFPVVIHPVCAQTGWPRVTVGSNSGISVFRLQFCGADILWSGYCHSTHSLLLERMLELVHTR